LRKPTRNSTNYLIASKPRNAGDPIITANVTTIAKTMPTITKRMFISKIHTPQLKTDCMKMEQIWKNVLKEKLQF
jgi:hypothetical protein